MTQFPVRVELQDRTSDRSCSFTISEQFLDCPAKGDHIIIPDGYLSVAGRFHFCIPGEEPSLLVTTQKYLVTNYDDMLRLFDWFKDQYEISDFKSDSEPALYYSLYRSIIRISDQKTVEDSMSIKVFSACASAVIVAELIPDGPIDFSLLNDAYAASSANVETLLNIVLNRKKSGDPIDLLEVVKEWEPLINPDASLKWEASEDICLDVAKFIFGRMKSIPADMLPGGLK